MIPGVQLPVLKYVFTSQNYNNLCKRCYIWLTIQVPTYNFKVFYDFYENRILI